MVANSNHLDDQTVKLKVRDSILRLMAKRLEKAENGVAAYQIAADSITDIEQTARGNPDRSRLRLSGNGFGRELRFSCAVLRDTGFPSVSMLQFGNIGEGRGQNWWCVLFPPLCLKNLDQDGDQAGGVELKLKVVEIIKERSRLNRSAGRQ